MNKSHLIVFIKNKEYGKVKTRLAKDIGNERAMAIYEQLLAHTAQVTAVTDCTKTIYFSQQVENDALWNSKDFRKAVQEGENLGERMQNAFAAEFATGAEKVIIIGSDTFEIEAEHMQQAFDALDAYDVVIGPAEDGGYYLLAMKQLHTQLFHNKEWSTSSVLKSTLKDLQNLNLSYHLLPELNDIDTLEDLERYQAKEKHAYPCLLYWIAK